ncbi:hypothetical protein GGER_25070 [Serratia rubidaea]
MRKLFVQFFLLLFVCFLVMAMLVGLVYKVTAERAGRQSMDDLMKSSLYLMRSELREIPLKDWNKTIDTLDLNLSFQLHIEPLGKQKLSDEMKTRLRLGKSSRWTISTPLCSAFRAAITCWWSAPFPTCSICTRCGCWIWWCCC